MALSSNKLRRQNKSNANQSRLPDTNPTKKSGWRRVGGGYENVAKRNKRNREKEFVTKVNGMSWENYQDSKRYIHLSKNVMNWDDKAAEEAFFAAKARFCRGEDVSDLNYPDLYIDNVDWSSKEEVEDDAFLSIEEEKKEDKDVDRRYPQVQVVVVNGEKYLMIPEWLENENDQIKATGWDDDYWPTLEGMIVGGP